jgi:HSP20 family protein
MEALRRKARSLAAAFTPAVEGRGGAARHLNGRLGEGPWPALSNERVTAAGPAGWRIIHSDSDKFNAKPAIINDDGELWRPGFQAGRRRGSRWITLTFMIKMVKSTAPADGGLARRPVLAGLMPVAEARAGLQRGDMPVIPKEPLEWLNLFRQQMNEIFRYLSQSMEAREGVSENEISPLVDIYETAESFVVEVELPGCQKKDVTLSLCCSTLVVEGVAREESGAGVNYICLERSTGRFCRAIEVPPGADLDGVQARYKRGLLTVVFPWSRKSRAHIRKIPIQ